MSVTVAKTAGFCFGVRRAVDLAEQQAKKNGKIYAYGEIIHNMQDVYKRQLQKYQNIIFFVFIAALWFGWLDGIMDWVGNGVLMLAVNFVSLFL